MRLELAWALTAAAVLVGCGIGNTGESDHEFREESRINNKPASEFYGQFRYRTDGDVSEGYSYLVSETLTLLSGERFYEVELYLLERGNFVLRYSEFVEPNAGSGLIIDFDEEFSGRFSVEGVHLVLSDIGIGNGIFTEGKEGVLLDFARDLNFQGLSQKSAALIYKRSGFSILE